MYHKISKKVNTNPIQLIQLNLSPKIIRLKRIVKSSLKIPAIERVITWATDNNLNSQRVIKNARIPGMIINIMVSNTPFAAHIGEEVNSDQPSNMSPITNRIVHIPGERKKIVDMELLV